MPYPIFAERETIGGAPSLRFPIIRFIHHFNNTSEASLLKNRLNSSLSIPDTENGKQLRKLKYNSHHP